MRDTLAMKTKSRCFPKRKVADGVLLSKRRLAVRERDMRISQMAGYQPALARTSPCRRNLTTDLLSSER